MDRRNKLPGTSCSTRTLFVMIAMATWLPLGGSAQSAEAALAITLSVPPSVQSNVRCNTNTAQVTWSQPSASSGCSGVTLHCSGYHVETASPWDQARVMNGGIFPVGTNLFDCQATDDCGGDVTHEWTVVVLNRTTFAVEMELGPSVASKPGDALTRCIEFEVFENCVVPPVTFQTNIDFGGLFQLVGHFDGVVNIPSAVFPYCVSARDPLHTLRSCYLIQPGDCDGDGVLHSRFQGDPFFNGNWLIGGNLDGWRPTGQTCRGGPFDGEPCASDVSCAGGTCENTTLSSLDLVDILDVGSIIGEWLEPYDSDGDLDPDGHTPCGEFTTTHADMNGDGLVDLLDYSFVAMNFLKSSIDCCCPGSVARAPGLTEVTVEELIRGNRRDLVPVDINRDGVLNLRDISLFMQGQRPTRPLGPPAPK